LIEFALSDFLVAVFIPDHTRGTVCVSSQVGCTLSCTFWYKLSFAFSCSSMLMNNSHTGTQKIVRNLTAGEIVSQILQARSVLFDFPGTLPEDHS
jgi:23S rRNA (adenine2503-C2)-methyltransferase